jgi:beta-mannosidase
MNYRDLASAADLTGSWRFTFEPAEGGVLGDARSVAQIEASGAPVYDATVPGNFELDLQANGLIGEPFHGMNIAGLTRFEAMRVVYWRTFQAPDRPGLRPILEAQGIDCYATVVLNGRVAGRCDNMLVEHRFELQPEDLHAENEIIVIIEPPLRPAEEADYPPLLQAMAGNYESLRTRKAPHMYGWDIMPRALSAGIWRPMRILYLPDERIDDAYLETLDIAQGRNAATLNLHYTARLRGHPHDDYELLLEASCGEASFSRRRRILYGAGSCRFDVPNPLLWWPRGRGDQNLYDCTLSLLHKGEKLDEVHFPLGIRTVSLERTEVTDEAGRGEFCFYVNGERLFVLGTNWVPLDAYHSRDIQRVDAAMDLVQEIGCNMIRCWGGNVYESDRFYDLCDRMGVLVWQDFSMACAVYPQDEAFQETLRREAVKVVRRLRQHPCVALWAGDNECDYSYLWGAGGVDPNTNVLTRKTLPEVLRNEDQRRPYLPSSPYIAPGAVATGTEYLPENHLWGPRDYYKSEFYRTALCHFASEIGYHGCPDADSIRQFLTPEAVWPYKDNPEWLLHGTSPIPGVNLFDYRVELMANQVRVLFGTVPDDLESFVYASQSSQAEAMKFFIETFRSQKWRRTGIIWWNILDGWPQFSDAVVDYYFRRKRAYATIRRSQTPLCMILREPEEGEQEIVICSDLRDRVPVRFTVSGLHTGQTLAQGEEAAGADCVTVVGAVPYAPEEQRVILLEWDTPSGPGWNYYLAGQPPFDLNWYRTAMSRLEARGEGTPNFRR